MKQFFCLFLLIGLSVLNSAFATESMTFPFGNYESIVNDGTGGALKIQLVCPDIVHCAYQYSSTDVKNPMKNLIQKVNEITALTKQELLSPQAGLEYAVQHIGEKASDTLIENYRNQILDMLAAQPKINTCWNLANGFPLVCTISAKAEHLPAIYMFQLTFTDCVGSSCPKCAGYCGYIISSMNRLDVPASKPFPIKEARWEPGVGQLSKMYPNSTFIFVADEFSNRLSRVCPDDFSKTCQWILETDLPCTIGETEEVSVTGAAGTKQTIGSCLGQSPITSKFEYVLGTTIDIDRSMAKASVFGVAMQTQSGKKSEFKFDARGAQRMIYQSNFCSPVNSHSPRCEELPLELKTF